MNFKKIYWAVNPDELSKKEKFIHCLFFLVMINIIPIILCSLMYYYYSNWTILLYPISLTLITAALCVRVVFYGRINKKFPVDSEIKGYPFSSYQFATLIFILFIPGVFVLFLMFGLILDKVVLALGLTLSFIVPGIGLYLRNNVFNDNSCYLGDNIVYGYQPGLYWTLSLFIGLYGYFNGFKNVDGYGNLIWIVIVFLFQLILLFPDKFNKIFPLEIRTKEGCIAFLGSVAVLFAIFAILAQKPLLGIGTQIIHFNFKAILCWIIGIILTIIIIKKYKDIWK